MIQNQPHRFRLPGLCLGLQFSGSDGGLVQYGGCLTGSRSGGRLLGLSQFSGSIFF